MNAKATIPASMNWQEWKKSMQHEKNCLTIMILGTRKIYHYYYY